MKRMSIWMSTLLFCANALALNNTPSPYSPFDRSLAGHLFTISGSNTVGASLAPSWAKTFLEQKGATRVRIDPLPTRNEFRVQGYNGNRALYIDIHAHGSSTGFVSLEQGQAAVAMSSRAIKNDEHALLAKLADFRHHSSEHIVAIDGLAVIVNRENSVNRLSVEEIARIFAGEIKNWQQLGGINGPINVYARDQNSGTWDTFDHLVLRGQHNLIAHAPRFESNDTLSDRVASDLNGIGFVGLASLRNAKALAIGDGKTTAIKPEHIYVATEDYPLSRRLYLYTPSTPFNALAQEFVNFAQGEIGQGIVEQVGFVSQNPMPMHVSVSNGPQFYQELSKQARRMSVNFRFQPGDAKLDNKARRDVRRLAEYLQQQDQSLRIQLVGFSNKKEDPSLATVLSQLRATAVKMELFRHNILTESVEGYGAERPVADTWGTSGTKNDRVEVWVYPDEADQALDSLRRETVRLRTEPAARQRSTTQK